MNKVINLMVESKLFEGLKEAECQAICSFLQPTIRKLDKGEVVIHEREKLEYMGIVFKGKLAGVKYDYEGNTHLLQIMEKGNLFGLETMSTQSRISPITIVSVEESSVLKFSQDYLQLQEVLPLKFQIIILSNIIGLLANENIKKLYKIDMLSSKSLRGRILNHLHLMKSKLGNASFSIGMNREQFAQYLCVNRSALSHELSLMKKDGLIAFEKDHFTLYDK